jgi:hypothetical protein
MAARPRRRAARRGTPTEYRGQRYRSAFEADVARDCHTRGVVVGYETETLFYQTSHFTRIDFTIVTASGKTIYVEAKGYLPAEDKAKIQAIVECNPDVDYRMVFQREDKNYVNWAKKHGIKHAIGRIPSDWLEE